MEISPLIIQLISGAVGGNVAGSILRTSRLALWATPLSAFFSK